MFGITEDEAIFIGLNMEVLFHGQPCGMILADNMQAANLAAKKVKISYEKIGTAFLMQYCIIVASIEIVKNNQTF